MEKIEELLDMQFWGYSLGGVLTVALKALLLYVVIRVAASAVKALFRRASGGKDANRGFLDQTTAAYLQRIVVYVIYTLGIAFLLPLIPGMEAVGKSLLAGAGIMAMAVGFASKEALSNFIGGLFIVFGKPFRIGDFIRIDDTIVGTVTAITLRHTVIRNAENRVIIVPNSKMNSDTIVNSTTGNDRDICSFIEVGVAYTVNLDHAIRLMREEIMKHPLLIDRRSAKDKQNNVPQVVIRVIELGDFAITLKAWAWSNTPGNAGVLKFDSLKAIKERFDAEGIEIPYPYRNVLVKNIPS